MLATLLLAVLTLLLPASAVVYEIHPAVTDPTLSWSVPVTNYDYDQPTPNGALVGLSDLRSELLWLHWWMNVTCVSDGSRITSIALKTAKDVPMCLDASHIPKPGLRMKVWRCYDLAWQTWEWRVEGSGENANSTFRVQGTDLCVENNNGVVLGTCDDNNEAQRWKTYSSQQ